MAEQPSAAQLKQRTEELTKVLQGLQTSIELRRWCIEKAIHAAPGSDDITGLASDILAFVTAPVQEALKERKNEAG